ncbi:hypothetical protein [Listeria cornellensis]|uniref:Uncharacterized protein n=1 Tax=Listeria cornellensis FSL F6-0969 TaxID=1265820 RepID=W7C1U3_9LIST|nr:hypothetical protein [Listeria cornellensis]EUJ29571.1 hypothetical protein PCORN_10442 [Listeria cornellensis FSL F6-0969]
MATTYEQEFVAQQLTKENIDYITDNLIPLIELVTENQENKEEKLKIKKQMDVVKAFISQETLTILQLIGFNFKKALGEPLTEIAKISIESIVKNKNEIGESELAIERDIEIYKVLQKEEAYQRLLEMKSSMQ